MQRREKKPRTQQRIRGNKESTTGLLNEPRPLFLQEEGGGFTRKPQRTLLVFFSNAVWLFLAKMGKDETSRYFLHNTLFLVVSGIPVVTMLFAILCIAALNSLLDWHTLTWLGKAFGWALTNIAMAEIGLTGRAVVETTVHSYHKRTFQTIARSTRAKRIWS